MVGSQEKTDRRTGGTQSSGSGVKKIPHKEFARRGGHIEVSGDAVRFRRIKTFSERP